MRFSKVTFSVLMAQRMGKVFCTRPFFSIWIIIPQSHGIDVKEIALDGLDGGDADIPAAGECIIFDGIPMPGLNFSGWATRNWCSP